MLMTGSGPIDAERAFTQVARSRRRAAHARRLRREPAGRHRLPVYDERALPRAGAPGRGIREIPLEAISGTLEPSRATLFDRCFRPAGGARRRWQRLWLAEHRDAVLPPISVARWATRTPCATATTVSRWRGRVGPDDRRDRRHRSAGLGSA
jgi:hypothetical protein